MKVTVVSRRDPKKTLATLQLNDNATLEDLKVAFCKETKHDINRQYYNYIENGKVSSGIRPGTLKSAPELVVAYKRLGTQVGYQTVFIVEYLVPLLSFPIIYALYGFIYGENPNLSWQQWLAFWLHTAHFFKREAETFLVHKFSNATMPLMNIFKNSSYYWAYAFLCGYFILHPQYTPPSSDLLVYICAALFIVCMICNGYCHIILSSLRKGPNDRNKYIPRGFFFELVTCPNYFFEITEWLIFFVQTQSIPVLLFALTGAGQMYVWALGKHKGLKKIFDGKEGRELYPKRRKVLFPYLI